MPVDFFLDTNILLYGYDLDSLEKRQIAQPIIEQAWLQPGSTAISVQVLQEFFVNFIRKGQSAIEARNLIEDFSIWPVVDNSMDLFKNGLIFQDRYNLSLWDAMITAAANATAAKIILTEDLNHGQIYGNVEAVNPFRNP